MALPTNYQDDILDTDENTRRKYTMVANEDGTYSFVDATVYTQEGSTYSASITNAQNAAINALSTKLSTLQSTFQDGLEQIADTLTSLGVPTSAADSSEDFETNLATLASNQYAAGVSATQVGTAVASQVLYGKTFTNASGVGLTGSMTNYSSNIQTITCNSTNGTVTYDINDGYHTKMYVNQSAPYSAGWSVARTELYTNGWATYNSNFQSQLNAAITYASNYGVNVSSIASSVLSAWNSYGSSLSS